MPAMTEFLFNQADPVSMLQKTHVEIDLGAIGHNLSRIREKAGGGVKILLAIKADGYGHGAIPIARYVERRGLADALGVASPSEGIELREAGITLPILVLGLILPDCESLEAVFNYSLSQTVADTALARAIDGEAARRGTKANVHLKVDTGMGRIGCRADEAVRIAQEISSLDGVRLEGIFTHFPVSDDTSSAVTSEQVRTFSAIVSELQNRGIRIPLVHAANSAGILNFSESYFTMVRPGILAYGYMPSPDCCNSVDIIPSMTFTSCIMFKKRVPPGTALSYGLTHTTARETTIATIPVGYGDGYSRALSNKGLVIIRDRLYPVVGRVCMDQILIDLGDDDFPTGEKVVLFGTGAVTAETIAGMIGTIPYEVTCGISKRVPRIYVNGD